MCQVKSFYLDILNVLFCQIILPLIVYTKLRNIIKILCMNFIQGIDWKLMNPFCFFEHT